MTETTSGLLIPYVFMQDQGVRAIIAEIGVLERDIAQLIS
jgi:hypothetical protein